MPVPNIRIKEIAGSDGSLSMDSAQHKRTYDVWDVNRVATLGDMRAAVLSTIPSQLDMRSAVEISSSAPPMIVGLANLDWDEDESGHHLFTATYTSRHVESLLRFGWDSTGGTVRMRASRSTSRYPRSGTTAPDFYGAIEVQDGKPEGVDIAIPALKLVFTYRWPRGVINMAHVKATAGMVGTTNNATFQTFAAGELLFLGSTGELDPTAPTEVQYHFAASANVTGLSIGGIASIAKQGHQYLWVHFDPSADTGAQALIQRPRACYVETVYGASDFSTLGIGV